MGACIGRMYDLGEEEKVARDVHRYLGKGGEGEVDEEDRRGKEEKEMWIKK